jgi:hypothetical protein
MTSKALDPLGRQDRSKTDPLVLECMSRYSMFAPRRWQSPSAMRREEFMALRTLVIAAGLVGGALLATFTISSCLDELMRYKTASVYVLEGEPQAATAYNVVNLR